MNNLELILESGISPAYDREHNLLITPEEPPLHILGFQKPNFSTSFHLNCYDSKQHTRPFSLYLPGLQSEPCIGSNPIVCEPDVSHYIEKQLPFLDIKTSYTDTITPMRLSPIAKTTEYHE